MTLFIMLSKPVITMIFGVFAGVLAIGTAVTQWSDQKDSDKEKREYQDSIKEANKEISESNRQIIRLQTEALQTANSTEKKTAELAELYKENALLQEELKNQVTGGNTRPKLIITCSYDPNNKYKVQLFDFDLVSEGKYPLSNVKFKINDPWGRYAAPFIKFYRGVMSFGQWEYVPPRQDLYNDWQDDKELDMNSILPGQRKQAYNTALIPFNGGNGNMITDGIFSIIVEWNTGIMTYSVRTEVKNNKIVIKTLQIKENEKEVSVDKFFSFNFIDIPTNL